MPDEKSTDENQPAPVQMCIIPQDYLQAVWNWLNGDDQTMPQNEVRQYLKLLEAAQLVPLPETDTNVVPIGPKDEDGEEKAKPDNADSSA